MRVVAIVFLLGLLPWLLGSQSPSWAGAAGGLLILILPFLFLRGVWLLSRDWRNLSRRLR